MASGLESLPTDVPIYAGTPGYGRNSERDALRMGVSFTEFAMGGCCEVMNRKAAAIFSRAADACHQNSLAILAGRRTPSHDVEIGRCFNNHGIKLTHAPWKCTLFYPSRLLPSNQMPSAAPCERRLSSDGFVHPLKSTLSHLAYYSRQPFFSADCSCAENPLALAMSTSCSKWMVPDDCSIRAPKCAISTSITIPAKTVPIEAHMITLDSSFTPPDFEGFDIHTFDATDNRGSPRTPTLTSGELGLLMSWKRLLTRQVARNVQSFALFEDDAIQVASLDSLSAECLSPLERGGFVILGWTNWNEWLWKLLLPSKSCVEVTPKTCGTFAAILSIEAAVKILWWIDATAGTLPIDHAWGHLSALGVPCSAAFPHIFIAREDHISFVDPNRTVLSRGPTSRWPQVRSL